MLCCRTFRSVWYFLVILLCFFNHHQFILSQTAGFETDLELSKSTLDLVENDESVVPLKFKDSEKYTKVKYVNSPSVHSKGDENDTSVRLDREHSSRGYNESTNRFGFFDGSGFGFNLFGINPSINVPSIFQGNRGNNVIPVQSQEYQDNPYLANQFNVRPTTERYDQNTRKVVRQQNQWENQNEDNIYNAQGSNWPSSGSSSWSQNPQGSNWQSAQSNNWNQNDKGFSHGQQSSPQNNWQNTQPNSWYNNEERPVWGSQSENSGSKWDKTTKRPNSNSEWNSQSNNQNPVWTTTDRYRPSPTKRPQRKAVSELKCEEYSTPYTQTINALPLSLDPELLSINVGKCDKNAQALIVGGQKADVGEFPHMVAVGFRSRAGLSWNCGGSLISENFVMTAAHCTDSSLGKPAAVRLGELNLVRNDDGANPENFKVIRVYIHPDYRSDKKYNDIALLKLDRNVQFNDNVRPACLNSQNSVRSARAIATGWGAIGFGDRTSEHLLKVGLTLIDNDKCKRLYQSEQSSSLNKGIIGTQLCAGELQGGYDTCLGDSGGPLQVTSDTNKCIYKIIGITSFGKFCAEKNSPGVYTRVSSFVPWIESIVWP